MKKLPFGRRSILSVMVAMVAVVLLATSASSYSRRDPALSGVWQDWGDTVWEYYYFAPTDSEFWRFKSNGQVRFAFTYENSQPTTITGQWMHYAYGHGGFFPIGQRADYDFLGDDQNWHVVDVDNHWSYQYWWTQDCGYWRDDIQNETRFAYKYVPGQWWDYTKANNGSWTAWSHLGLGALATAAFLGDGAWHTFRTANRPGGMYGGYTTDAQFRYDQDAEAYIWKCGGIERYKFVYEDGYTGSWWEWNGSTWANMTYGSSYENIDVRYHAGGIFVGSRLAWDPGTDRPADVPSPRNIEYGIYYMGGSSPLQLGVFRIYNPGPDNKWGADASNRYLNVLWCHNDFHAGLGEYTKEDVVVFITDMTTFTFAKMVDAMTLVRDYFRQQISTVMVASGGSSTGWYMGEWMNTSNYAGFQSDWQRWGNLMTADGQLISLHSETGLATDMLNAIAGWSGIDIFANTNIPNIWYDWIISPNVMNPSVWNYNMANVLWGDPEESGLNRFFEFTTTGLQNYRWILYY